MTTFSPSDGGQGRDPEVDRRPVDRHPGAAVLRTQPVGDVEPGHDLDAGDERNSRAPRNLHHLPEHTVDAVAHHHAALDGLDVDVAGPALDAVREQQVHQPDDRPLARLARPNARSSSGSSSSCVTSASLHAAAAACSTTSSVTVQLIQFFTDAGRRSERQPDFPAGGEGQHLLGIDVERDWRSRPRGSVTRFTGAARRTAGPALQGPSRARPDRAEPDRPSAGGNGWRSPPAPGSLLSSRR